jgi:uncharacterized protein with von Willebrand factor type A (vWA) domain
VTDLATLVAGFERALAERAVIAGTRRAHALADVLRLMPPANRTQLYWRARVAMLPSIDDLDGFDAAFAQVFGTRDAARTVPRRRNAPTSRPNLRPSRPASTTPAPHRSVG